MEDLLRKLKVLYIEDDLVHREELADYLSRRVGRLYLAENGEQGYEKYKSLNPDLVITDLRMPKLGGIELAGKIREENKTVPIIILTAMSDKESILEAVKIGILDYVLKPVDVKELMNVIGKAIGTITAIDSEFGQLYYEPEKLNALKSELTSYIKRETGKGPVDIRFRSDEDELEVTFIGTLTKYETALIKNMRNENMVEYNRSVFLKDRLVEIEKLIAKHLNTDQLTAYDVRVDINSDQCTVRFKREV